MENQFHLTINRPYDYLFMMGFKLIQISKSGPKYHIPYLDPVAALSRSTFFHIHNHKLNLCYLHKILFDVNF